MEDDRIPRWRERREEPRPFRCRTCGRAEEAVVVPEGWYSLNRHLGIPRESPQRLGVFCSLKCLVGRLPEVQREERRYGKEWVSSLRDARSRGAA